MNPIYAQLARQQRERREGSTAAVNPAVSSSSDETPWQLFFERDAEVGELYRVLNHRKGGRSSVVIVHGDGSCGKTTLIRKGLIPKFQRKYSDVFDSFAWKPKNGDDHLTVIEELVTQLLGQLPTHLDDELISEENQRRYRHFRLLFDGDSGEAAEYLAALFREAHIDQGPADAARCLLFLDQFDRFFPNGLIADASPRWIEEELLPMMAFLFDLALTNAFPLVVAVRSFNVDGLKQALARSGRRMTLDWKRIDPLPPSSLSELVDCDLSLPTVEPALVARCEELLASHPGALAFLEDTWRAQGILLRPPLKLKFFESEQPLEKVIASVAETAVAPLCEDPAEERGLHQLLDLFFPVPEGDARLRAVRLPFTRLAERPAVVPIATALIDARVLHPGGDCPENASIAWSVPRFFRHWERGFEWLQRDREIRESAQQLASNVSAWEEAEHTPVLLLHGTASVELARELVDYDAVRPFLAAGMRNYLNATIETDVRLHQGKKASASDHLNETGDRETDAGKRVRDWLAFFRPWIRRKK